MHVSQVMVCCETYKFHERVQLDSITSNELGDPDVLVDVPFRPEVSALRDWRSLPRLGESPLSSPYVILQMFFRRAAGLLQMGSS